ncbi:MAG: hypothetical protein Q4D16_10915 [Eubacteriales bacterium]|nr:hypothetical protein [Eubacteriales bacterium]
MSIVIACANQSRVVIKSDGREKSEYGAILSEDQNWFTQLSEQCFVGYAGDKIVCDMLIIALKKQLEEDNIKDIRQIALALQHILQATSETTTDNCSFIIAGISQETPQLYGLSYQDHFQTLLDKSPADKNVICKNLIIGPPAMADAEPFNKMYDTNKTIESNMNDYIRYMGTIDKSVNDHIRTGKLKLS